MKRKPVLPPIYLLTAILLMLTLHLAVPVWTVLVAPYRYAGILLVVIGLGMILWAGVQFKRADTTTKPFKQPRHLVTGGLYRFSRNPMYLGSVLILVGVAVLCGSVSPALVIPVFAWLMQVKFILPEEKALDQTFGDEFRAYKNRVRRWI